MQELSRRNEHFTDSVIRRMTRISIDCGAINLAQGFPDFDPPKAMTDRLEEVSRLGPHQYPITMGAPNFRQALSRKCERFMGMKYDPETEMVVTIGSTEAMVDTIFALTNPGDKIVMFSPYFENYRAQTIMAGCEPVFVPLVQKTFSLSSGACLLTAILVLTAMILPYIVSVSETALRAVPREYEEASLALGATNVETWFLVSLKAAKSGVIASIIQGTGRAVGEAMAILMVAGNVANMPSLFASVRFLTTAIVSEMSYAAYGSLQRDALFSVGLVLFLFILLINAALRLLSERSEKA